MLFYSRVFYSFIHLVVNYSLKVGQEWPSHDGFMSSSRATAKSNTARACHEARQDQHPPSSNRPPPPPIWQADPLPGTVRRPWTTVYQHSDNGYRFPGQCSRGLCCQQFFNPRHFTTGNNAHLEKCSATQTKSTTSVGVERNFTVRESLMTGLSER